MIGVKVQVATAQLSIMDGAWQESPDNIAAFDEASLFGEGLARGSLYIVTEVAGESEGRDVLARELVETVRREYATSRGSISLALTQAMRAANEFFFATNANLPPDARRIAGMTAAILRDDELFIAQAGPGMVCLMRGEELQRYPETSSWFMADESAVAEWLASRDFATPGAVPIGLRRTYTPDLFHASMQSGDTIILSTRTLAHLLSAEELRDTLGHRHPDEIVASLEDLAGAADLSVIALRVAGEPVAPTIAVGTKSKLPIFAPLPQEEEVASSPFIPSVPLTPLLTHPERSVSGAEGQERGEGVTGVRGEAEPTPQHAEPTKEELAHQRAQAERAAERRAKVRSTMLRAGAGTIGAFAGVFGRINWTGIGNAADRAIDGTLRSIARTISFLIRAVVPGEPEEQATAPATPAPSRSSAWQLASIVFPILLIVAGVIMWVSYRAEQQRIRDLEVTRLVEDAGKALDRAKQLEPTDKNAARDPAQNAMDLAKQALTKSPGNVKANTIYNDASDLLDRLKGIAAVFAQPLFTFSDPRANPTRIVAQYPNIFILDRGTSRIHRYTITEAGTVATPVSGDGVILKTGEKISDRIVGQLIDLALVDSARLVALDRNGGFLQYDIARSIWSARGAGDPAPWARVNLATSFNGNMYLVDAPRNQILKYVPNQEGWWTSSVTFFVPGASLDLSNVVDLSIDADVWLLRSNGSILQCNTARCNESAIRDLDAPLSKPVAGFTSQTLPALYVADAGNQRIVQIDKGTSRFARQFKPSAQNPDVFKSLKTLTADEKKFYWISENKAYLANIPQ